MPENGYRIVVSRMADEELITALNANETMYLDEMLLAVLEECEKRNISFTGAKNLKEKLLKRYVPEKEEPVLVNETATVKLPTLYSQTAILAFSIFFSPLFGGILLAMNVGKVNKKGVWQVILFSIVFTAFYVYVASVAPTDNFFSWLIPFAGALILSEVLWNHFLGKNINYKKRTVAAPLIIGVLITIIICAYLYFFHPELLPLPKK